MNYLEYPFCLNINFTSLSIIFIFEIEFSSFILLKTLLLIRDYAVKLNIVLSKFEM